MIDFLAGGKWPTLQDLAEVGRRQNSPDHQHAEQLFYTSPPSAVIHARSLHVVFTRIDKSLKRSHEVAEVRQDV